MVIMTDYKWINTLYACIKFKTEWIVYNIYISIGSLKVKEIINDSFFLQRSLWMKTTVFNDLMMGHCLLGSNAYTCQTCVSFMS